jgi:hypothetical protein
MRERNLSRCSYDGSKEIEMIVTTPAEFEQSRIQWFVATWEKRWRRAWRPSDIGLSPSWGGVQLASLIGRDLNSFRRAEESILDLAAEFAETNRFHEIVGCLKL